MINMPALPPNDKNVSPLSLGLSAAHHNDSIGGGDSSVESSVVETNVFLASCFNDELKGGGGESDAEGEGYALAKSFRESAVLAQRDRIDDGNVIEDDVADYDNNWTLADAEEGTVCGIEGAPMVGFRLVLLKRGSTVSKSIVVSLILIAWTTPRNGTSIHSVPSLMVLATRTATLAIMRCLAEPSPYLSMMMASEPLDDLNFSIKDGLPKMTSLDSVVLVQHVITWCPMTGFLP
jgi:hypothetical protein